MKELSRSPPKLPPPIVTELEQKIVEMIEHKATISRTEMAAALGIRSDVVKEYLKKLKDKGLLERKETNRTGYWKIISQSGQNNEKEYYQHR